MLKILKTLRIFFNNECHHCDGHYIPYDWRKAYCNKCGSCDFK